MNGDPANDRELQRLIALRHAGKTANSDFNRDSPILSDEEIRKEEEKYKRMMGGHSGEESNRNLLHFRSLHNSSQIPNYEEDPSFAIYASSDTDKERLARTHQMLREYEEMMMEKRRERKSLEINLSPPSPPTLSKEDPMTYANTKRPSLRQKKLEEKAQVIELKKRMYTFTDAPSSSSSSTISIAPSTASSTAYASLLVPNEKTPIGRGRSASMNKSQSQTKESGVTLNGISNMKYTSSDGDLAALEAEAERREYDALFSPNLGGNYDDYLSPSSRRYHRGQRQKVTVAGSLSFSKENNNLPSKNPLSPAIGLISTLTKPENSPKSMLRTSWNNGFKIFKKDNKESKESKETKVGIQSPKSLANQRIDSGELLFNYASSNVEGNKTKLAEIEQMYAEGRQNEFPSYFESNHNSPHLPLKNTKVEEQSQSNPSSPRSHEGQDGHDSEDEWSPSSSSIQKSQNRRSIVESSGFPGWLNYSISSDDAVPSDLHHQPPPISPRPSLEGVGGGRGIGGGYTNNLSSIQSTKMEKEKGGYVTSAQMISGEVIHKEEEKNVKGGGYTSNSGALRGGGYTNSSAEIANSPKISDRVKEQKKEEEMKGGYLDQSTNKEEEALKSKFENMTMKPSIITTEATDHLDEETEEDVMVDVISLFGQLSREDQCDAGVELSEIFPGAIQRLRAGLKERVRRAKAETHSNEDGETWNHQFQQILENLNGCDDTQERISIYSQLSNLAQDFVHCAKTYGKLIISELYLPDDQKTIRPCDIGGFAGGLKYITKGILFKLAVDSNELYGSDMIAAKVAGNDLKGLVQYFNLGVSRLHFPLMALVDYMGFRIQAISLLPINTETLIYGTANGGKTVFDKNIKFNAKMRLAGKKLNLAPHLVGLSSKSSKVLYSCADMEGHDGKDGRFYLIDFARCFPPIDFSSSSISNSHLFRLFRPEFVRRYNKPLCPDTYSGFVAAHNPQKHIKDVKEATVFLHSSVIAECIEELNLCETTESLKTIDLKQMLHKKGINLLFLGLIRRFITPPIVRKFLLSEMIARVAKHEINERLREKMRELKLALKEPYKAVVVDYLNLLFGNSESSREYWTENMKEKIQYYFQESLLMDECSKQFDLRIYFEGSWCELFISVKKMSGLQFTPISVRDFETNPASFQFKKPFDSTDLEQIGDRVKHMNIVAVSMGFYLTDKASIKIGANSRRLFSLAVEKFEEALYSVPDDKMSLRELARVKAILGNRVAAQKHFEEAISADPKDPITNFRYAVFLEDSGQPNQAEEFYLKCLEEEPNDGQVLIRYADFLSRQGKTEDSQKFYALARRISKISSTKEEEIFENERRLPFSKEFSKANLLTSDERGPWSTRSGTPKSKEEVKPSANWEWITDWFIDRERWCDQDGWEYAFHWSSDWHSRPSHKYYVRRRKWKRVRRLKNDGKDQFNQSGLSLEEVTNQMKEPGKGILMEERIYNGKVYDNCFTGAEAVQWLMTNFNFSQVGAVAFGNRMLQNNFIQNTGGSDEPFQDGFAVYHLGEVVRKPVRGHRKTKSEIKMNEFDVITKQGYMEKQGVINPMWKKRWFILQKGSLHFYKRPKDEAARGTISLVRATVLAMKYPTDTTNYLAVKTGSRTYLLRVENGERDRDDWVKAISSCCI